MLLNFGTKGDWEGCDREWVTDKWLGLRVTVSHSLSVDWPMTRTAPTLTLSDSPSLSVTVSLFVSQSVCATVAQCQRFQSHLTVTLTQSLCIDSIIIYFNDQSLNQARSQAPGHRTHRHSQCHSHGVEVTVAVSVSQLESVIVIVSELPIVRMSCDSLTGWVSYKYNHSLLSQWLSHWPWWFDSLGPCLRVWAALEILKLNTIIVTRYLFHFVEQRW